MIKVIFAAFLLVNKLNWHAHYLQDKENRDHKNNSAGKFADARTRADIVNHGLRVNRQVAMNSNALVNSDNGKRTTNGVPGRSNKLVIRPISPSTLMALTEPCLMAWCTASDESLTKPGPSAYLPFQNSDNNNYDVDKKNMTVYNAWGY